MPLRRRAVLLRSSLLACLALSGCAATPTREALERDVATTERAFARTMADRDHAAFTTFLSEEAVFVSDDATLRGRAAVAEDWKRYFATPAAPFSWEPDAVHVLDSGTLALSSGPVRDASGRVIARFQSVWRLESPGQWRIVFDRGNAVCP
jgi:ketosteroid isomerase-like protein